jgi:hypothetical protein
MFQGMTIENLMASVERAEQQARQKREAGTFDVPANQQNKMEWPELLGVA